MVSKDEKYRNKFVQGGPHATSETGQAGQVLTRVHNNYNEFPLIQYKDFDEIGCFCQCTRQNHDSVDHKIYHNIIKVHCCSNG